MSRTRAQQTMLLGDITGAGFGINSEYFCYVMEACLANNPEEVAHIKLHMAVNDDIDRSDVSAMKKDLVDLFKTRYNHVDQNNLNFRLYDLHGTQTRMIA